MNPKLVRVLIGSLKGPGLILSHHLEASPIKFNESGD
tara:strand:+ start:1128 stop:1238 length:111 start_codon:yes stop_codon:yes gene_type:complete